VLLSDSSQEDELEELGKINDDGKLALESGLGLVNGQGSQWAARISRVQNSLRPI